METGCLVMAISESRGNLGSTKKETRNSSGDRVWSGCGTIGMSINSDISLIGHSPAMKLRRVILPKSYTRSSILPSGFTELMTRIDMERAVLG